MQPSAPAWPEVARRQIHDKPRLTTTVLIVGVFRAGLWVGAILVLIVVAVVVWILRKMRR